MKAINTGLAAFGMSGQVFHAPFISTNPHFNLSKVVERSKELSKARYPDATIVRSFNELIADSNLELIVVNTPDSTHFEYARMALEAGKNVVVEKPFTSTLKQAEELIALAKEKGLMITVYQNRRWDSDYQTLREILDKGLLGRVVEFESTFARYRNYIKPGTWKETGELGGGLVYNLGSHLIDQALLLFGMPEAVYADIDTLRSGGKVDDYFLIHFIRPEFDSRLKITLKASYLMREPEPRFTVHGTLGSFIKYGVDKQEAALLDGEMPNQPHWGEESSTDWGLLHTEINNEVIHQKYPSHQGTYASFYENIYNHLRSNTPLCVDEKSILNVIKVIEACYESQRKGMVIQLK